MSTSLTVPSKYIIEFFMTAILYTHNMLFFEETLGELLFFISYLHAKLKIYTESFSL